MMVYRPTPDHTAAFVGKVSINILIKVINMKIQEFKFTAKNIHLPHWMIQIT